MIWKQTGQHQKQVRVLIIFQFWVSHQKDSFLPFSEKKVISHPSQQLLQLRLLNVSENVSHHPPTPAASFSPHKSIMVGPFIWTRVGTSWFDLTKTFFFYYQTSIIANKKRKDREPMNRWKKQQVVEIRNCRDLSCHLNIWLNRCFTRTFELPDSFAE